MRSLILLTLLATVLTAVTAHATEKRHLKLCKHEILFEHPWMISLC